ncbi:MAG: hydroxyacid dehydrogenase [Betaproteobacteria bacterium]|nr:hydroxyacid dehydrogenase [Betaproteobacteria bacterium]
MNIVFHFDGSSALRARLASMGVELCPESDVAAFARLLPEVEVLWHVLKPVTADVIARAPKLRLVHKIGSGVNTIDVEACKARGIAVCNLPGTNSRAVAEMTLLLMLACLRRIRELDAAVRKPGGWLQAWNLQDHFGELGGRTVGLVGYGAVPKILQPILEAMGCTVLYWSRSAHRDKKCADLETVLSQSDIVSLHIPLTPETTGRIDPRRLKQGAILINTARGGLVNEAGLLEALRSGHLRAAGLDVFGEEPVNPAHPLLALPNVIASPHLAWLTPETIERSLGLALQNARRLEAGQALENRVA